MTIDFDADLSSMLTPDEFGIEVTIRGERFRAIFDADYAAAQLGQVDIESKIPVLTCRSSDLERIQVVKDDAVEGLPEEYRVKRIQADGTGMSLVYLKR